MEVPASEEEDGYVKTIPAEKDRREGVDMRTGVWSVSDSEATTEATDVTGLTGIVIFGLGLSFFSGFFVEGPGTLDSSGSSLMAAKEESEGLGSESESESSILQIGR
ncbi:hypothetical protein ILYODFUR_019366 [Ilyodon furcidens]|uniref:Uncharacterized protein n=1 Tax=Ilyodon furcidens TaxID=33524 RepID=A0ABV0ULG9_9TELE